MLVYINTLISYVYLDIAEISLTNMQSLVILSTDRVNFDVTEFLRTGEVVKLAESDTPSLKYHNHVNINDQVFNIMECHVKFVSIVFQIC